MAVASARVVAAEGLRTQAGLKPNTRLILQSENARLAGASPFRYSQDTDNFAYLAQVFEAGGKRQRRVEVASQNVRANELSLESHRAQLAARVLTAYWIAAGAQRLAAVLADSVSVLERTVQYHRDRVREGSLPGSRPYPCPTGTATGIYRPSKCRTGCPTIRSSTISGDGNSGADGCPPRRRHRCRQPVPLLDIDEAVERRPDVRLSVQSVKQAEAALRLQKANAVPDPEVLFGYKRTSGFNTVIAGLQLNLPVRNQQSGSDRGGRSR